MATVEKAVNEKPDESFMFPPLRELDPKIFSTFWLKHWCQACRFLILPLFFAMYAYQVYVYMKGIVQYPILYGAGSFAAGIILYLLIPFLLILFIKIFRTAMIIIPIIILLFLAFYAPGVLMGGAAAVSIVSVVLASALWSFVTSHAYFCIFIFISLIVFILLFSKVLLKIGFKYLLPVVIVPAVLQATVDLVSFLVKIIVAYTAAGKTMQAASEVLKNQEYNGLIDLILTAVNAYFYNPPSKMIFGFALLVIVLCIMSFSAWQKYYYKLPLD